MTTYQLPHCVLCDRSCIPLADYDVAVCVKCDDDMGAVMIRARYEPADGQHPWAGLPPVTGCGTPAGYVAHVEHGDQPCWPCTHFMDIALQNTIAWAHARTTEDGEAA